MPRPQWQLGPCARRERKGDPGRKSLRWGATETVLARPGRAPGQQLSLEESHTGELARPQHSLPAQSLTLACWGSVDMSKALPLEAMLAILSMAVPQNTEL